MSGFVQPWSELGRGPVQFGDVSRAPQAPRDAADERSVLGAAWRLENVVGSNLANHEVFDNWIDDSYNPLEDQENEGYHEFTYLSKNAAHARVIRNNIDQQLRDKDTLSRSGMKGFLATMAVTAADPVTVASLALPSGIAVRGGSLLRAAAVEAASGFAGAAVAETMLARDQQTRTREEILMNLASATVLGGLLGAGGMAAFKRANPGAYARLQRQAQGDIREALAGTTGKGAGTPAAGTPAARSTGAAGLLEAGGGKLRNARVLEWMRDNPVAQIFVNMSPGIRGMLSRSKVMRRATSGVAEHGLRLNPGDVVDEAARASGYQQYATMRTTAGEAPLSQSVWNDQLDKLLEADSFEDVQRLINQADDTTVELYRAARAAETSAGAVETMVKRWSGPLADAYQEGDRQFYLYLNRVKADGAAGEKVMDFGGFNNAVGRALRKSERELALEPPEVQAAVGRYRQVFDGLRDEALKFGLFPKSMETADQLRESISDTADNYFTRQFDFNAITARRAEFENRIAEWYVHTIDAELGRQHQRIADVESRGMTAADLALREHATLERHADFEHARLTRLKEERADIQAETTEYSPRDAAKRLERDISAFDRRSTALAESIARDEARIAELKDWIDVSRNTRNIREQQRVTGWSRERGYLERGLKAQTENLRGISVRRGRAAKRLENVKGAKYHRPAASLARVSREIAQQNERIRRVRRRLTRLERAAGKAEGRRNARLIEMRARVAELELELEYAPDVARSITDNILSQPIGASMRNVLPEAGPLKERVLGIPDSAIEDFLVNDVRQVAANYTRQMAPDVEIARWLDGRTVDDVLTEIGDDYNAMREAVDAGVDPAELARINELGTRYAEAGSQAERRAVKKQLDEVGAGTYSKEMKRLADAEARDKRDLHAMLARIKGVYGAPENPNSPWVRVSRMVRQHALVTKLGGMTLSAIPDLVRHTMRGNTSLSNLLGGPGATSHLAEGLRAAVHGLRRRGALQPGTAAHAELRRMGAVTELAMNDRVQQMMDFQDYYNPRSGLERGLQTMTDSFGKVSLMSHWNEMQKTVAGLSASDVISRSVLDGTNLGRLRASGISEDMLPRIRQQMLEHSEVHDGLRLTRSDQWTDRDAARAFESAVIKEVDATIVTPGVGDRPLWMSTEMGKLLGLFRSFSFAAHNRVLLAGITGAGGAMGHYVAQLSMLTALGLATGELKARLRTGGEEGIVADGDTAQQVAIKGLEYAGIGMLMEFNNLFHATTGYSLKRLPGQERDAESGRFAGRNAFDAWGGPAVGAFADIMRVARLSSDQKLTQSDLNAVWKLQPYQNVWYLQLALNGLSKATTGEADVRKAVGRAVGVEQ